MAESEPQGVGDDFDSPAAGDLMNLGMFLERIGKGRRLEAGRGKAREQITQGEPPSEEAEQI